MFETLFTCPGVLRRHREGPLAAERAAYLSELAAQGMARGTILRRSSYCLCVAVELQRWPSHQCFDEDDVEALAAAWAAKRSARGRASSPRWPKEHFRFTATGFLRSLGRLRAAPAAEFGRYDAELADFITAQQEGRWLSEETLYNTGARATEAAQLTVADLALGTSPSARFEGKGRKIRTCPLWSRTAKLLRELLGARIDGPRESPVFLNVRGQPITRYGIHALVARTVDKAAETVPSLRDKPVSPHTIRHTTAVHLLRAGVDINTIRAWLGHVSLETTNRYAEVDLEMKAKALETCAVTGPDPAPTLAARWRTDGDLMSFLTFL